MIGRYTGACFRKALVVLCVLALCVVAFYSSYQERNTFVPRQVQTITSLLSAVLPVLKSDLTNTKNVTPVRILSYTTTSQKSSIFDKRIASNGTLKDIGSYSTAAYSMRTTGSVYWDSVPNCNDEKFLAYTCRWPLCGGVGDREKGIISTYLLSLLTERVFVIDMSYPCALETFLDTNQYDWIKCKAHLSKFNNTAIKNYIILDSAGVKFAAHLNRSVTDSWWQYSVVKIKANGYYIDAIRNHPDASTKIPWLMKMSNEETIRNVLNNLFKLKHPMIDDIGTFFKLQVTGRKLICAHIRYGKNPTIPRDNHLRWGAPNVTAILSFLDKYNDVNKYAIYVATDSMQVRELAKERFINFINANVSIVHVDKVKANADDSCTGMGNVFLEQYLLSKCDTLVLTRSNFGAIAAYRRGHSDNLYLNDEKHAKGIVKANSIEDIQIVFQFK